VGDTSARHPWKPIAVWAVTVALVVGLAGAFGGTFVDEFSADGSESAEAVELLEERFPAAAGGTGVAVFAAPEGARLDAFRPAVDAALARVAAIEHVSSVSDPFTAGRISAGGRIGFADLGRDIPASDLGAEAFGTVAAALVPIAIALVAVGAGLGGVVVLAGVLDVSTAATTFGAMVGLGVGIDYSLFIVARYRDNRAAGQPNRQALSGAMGSSGTAGLFASMTVVVAMAALVLTGIGVLASIGLATSIIVLFAVATALTLLPALLSLLGDRIDAGTLRHRRRAPRPVEATSSWRLAHRIAARPWPYPIVASVLLLAVAAPALSIRSGFPDAGGDAKSTTQRKAYDLLAEGFGPGFNAPMLVVADLQRPGLEPQDVDALVQRLQADPGVAEVGAPRTTGNGDTVVLPTFPTTGPSDDATSQTLQRALTPDGVLVPGTTALTLDLDEQLSDALPLFIGVILVVSILLLMVVFRSVTVPLKAAAMNLLSIGGLSE